MKVPPLEPHCGSWIIVRKQTGKAVFETSTIATVQAVNRKKYVVLTAAEYLGRLNGSNGYDRALN